MAKAKLLCAVGAEHAYIVKNALEALGVELLMLPAEERFARPVRSHADMLIHPLPDGTIACCGEAQAATLRAAGFDAFVISGGVGECYPEDVKLNSFALSEVLFCNERAVALEIRARYSKLRHVAQGYTRCSVLLVDDRSVITADKGIYKAVREEGFDALRIKAGDIRLDGYGCGFIGGCGGLVESGKLLLCGDISLHPDGGRMLDFCADRGVTVIRACEGALVDIGGLIAL